MRQFIAIPLPEKVKQEFSLIIEPFRGIKGVKPVRPENMHLTLLFLGDTGTGNKIEELRNITFKSFTLKTTSVVLFPERKPRLIWIELEKSEPLLHLYNKIAGVFGVNEKLKAHITLARIKWLLPQDYRSVKEEIDRVNPVEKEFEVTCFNLYNSKLQPWGPIYRVEESFSG